ncbi:MAG: pyridoxal-phosphate dependent enzyme [Planctomycetaceae bacterium]|jgi:threonine synthase|nr:pyridoxal-phosphate dependent enzyme [Planctomycetaceae bacterium]
MAYQICINPDCGSRYEVDRVLHSCSVCGELLDVDYEWDSLPVPESLSYFERFRTGLSGGIRGFSGVWRYYDLLPFLPMEKLVSVGEGRTILQDAGFVSSFVGVDSGRFFLQYEGLNPSGSFKDNGMTAAFTHGAFVGAKQAACASTGNTSASLAIYAAATRLMEAVVFVGSGKIAYGKLSQALDYGAKTIQIQGDFDDALSRVRQIAKDVGIYLVNSINPFRLEGQKTIMYRVLDDLGWRVPDWIVVPGGNLGNAAAFGKAFIELSKLGLVDKVPRIAIINASGANTLHQLYGDGNGNSNGDGNGSCNGGSNKSGGGGEVGKLRWNGGRYDKTMVKDFYDKMTQESRKANTIASAIEINRPANLSKALRTLEFCDGVVREVTDQQIVDAKAVVGAGGFGCEPASAAAVAGAKLLVEEGIIDKEQLTVCILTGHQLKDPNATVAYHGTDQNFFKNTLGKFNITSAQFANKPITTPNDQNEILKFL